MLISRKYEQRGERSGLDRRGRNEARFGVQPRSRVCSWSVWQSPASVAKVKVRKRCEPMQRYHVHAASGRHNPLPLHDIGTLVKGSRLWNWSTIYSPSPCARDTDEP